MKVIFDPDISEELKEEILNIIKEENIEGVCKVCNSNTLYVALIGKMLDIKCYECGYSYLEVEIEEEEEGEEE